VPTTRDYYQLAETRASLIKGGRPTAGVELIWILSRHGNNPIVCTFTGVVARGCCKMLTILAILAGPILVATVLMIVVFEIKDAWDRNRLG
jgi:hypothetical protein